jgi:hypothetical protein
MKPEPPRAAQLSRFLLPMGKGGIHYQEFHVIAFPAIKEPSGEYGMVVGLRPVRPLNTSSLHGIYEITCTDCNFQSFLRDGLHNLNVWGFIPATSVAQTNLELTIKILIEY